MRRTSVVLTLVSLAIFLLACAPSALALEAPHASEVTTVTTPTAEPLVRLEDDDLRVRFAGAWKSGWARTMSGQTYRISRRGGASCWASFEGSSAALFSRLGPARGKASVYVDGSYVATVDLYSPTNTLSQSVWATDTLAPGQHSIKVLVTGTKNPASSGTYVIFDAFDVSSTTASNTIPGTPVNNGSAKLARSGSWCTSVRADAYGGSAWRTGSKGARVIVRFKGTGIVWLGRKDPSSGKSDVLLDGRRIATISQYSPTVLEQRVAFAVSGLPYGVHTLTIRCRDEASTAAGGDRADVDAFAVNGTILQAYRPTPFNYPWPTYIVIDKSSFRLYWVKSGMLIKTYPIAHGKPNTPTPVRVWRIDAKYRTDPSSVYGPRKMRLFKRVSTSSGYSYVYTNYAIHGTNEEWVIGTQASHGCIRMYNRDVLELWPQVPLGTMVVTRD